jgi:hypothetical protein
VVIAGAIFGAEVPQTAPVHEPALQIKAEAEAVVKDIEVVVPVVDVHPPPPACLRHNPGLPQDVVGAEPPGIELTVHVWVQATSVRMHASVDDADAVLSCCVD